jgi:hypothetical protein
MQTKIISTVRGFLADEDGAFIVEFGIAFPVLILLSFALLEFSLVVFDYQRAAEATRSGVRHTIISPPIANTANLIAYHDGSGGGLIVCKNPEGTVICDGGSPDENANARWAALMDNMTPIYPTLKSENVVVTYQGTDVGEEDEFGGTFPLVTLELVGVKHDMIVGHLIGIDTIEFPAFTTTVLGPGNYVMVAEQVGKTK